MHIPNIKELASKFKGGRYELIMVASKRAKELGDGAKPMVEINSSNPINIALAEMAAGKIKAGRIPVSAEKEEIKFEGNKQDVKSEEL